MRGDGCSRMSGLFMALVLLRPAIMSLSAHRRPLASNGFDEAALL